MVKQPVVGSSLLRRRIERETDPIVRRNLEVVLEHIQSERTTDYDRTMATMVRDCVIASHNWRANPFETPLLTGYDEVRESYKVKPLGGVFGNFDIDLIVADSETVVTEGIMRANIPGRVAIAAGHPVDDADAQYLIEARIIVTWPVAENGLLKSENVFLAAGGFEGIADRKLEPGTTWPPDEMP